MTSSYGTGELRDKEVWRRQGMRNFRRRSLLSFILKSSHIIVAPPLQNDELIRRNLPQ